MPSLNKDVVYLDQNAFSFLFKEKANLAPPKGHEDFSEKFFELSQRALRLQQVVFPHSNIHHDETTVYVDAEALRTSYKFLGGDLPFLDTDDVELLQTLKIAEAYISGEEPEFDFGPQHILRRSKDVWLPNMYIDVQMDFSRFADGIRKGRANVHRAMQGLIQNWQENRPSFDEVQNFENEDLGPAKIRAFFRNIDLFAQAQAEGDWMTAINASAAPIMLEFSALERLFSEDGVSEQDIPKAIFDFWKSDELKRQPFHVVFSHLIAAIARRVQLGQKRFSRGLMNDLKAVSTYALYVDAIFLDKEFDILLSETPQLSNLKIKSKVFSLRKGEEFLSYLESLTERASEDIRAASLKCYG